MSSSTGGRLERLTAFLGRNDRFFTPRMLASIGVYLVVAASYIQPRISDDGVIYYDFMRRLVGEDVPAFAYQFGVVFWDLPFYVLSRIVRVANDDDFVEHAHIGAISVAIASTAAIVAIFYVSWRLIRGLGLPGGPGAILLTVFGSPLFYYGIFQPGLKHAFDALLVSVLALLLLQATIRPPTTRGAVAHRSGARAADLRPLREHRAPGRGALRLLPPPVASPRVRGRSLGNGRSDCDPGAPAPAGDPVRSSPGRGGRARHGWRLPPPRPLPAATSGGVDNVGSFDIDLLAPAKMLFTVKRGLFVWTPLTFFGVVGYLLLLRREPRHRDFLVGLGLSALALLMVHIVWGGFWDGGFSFSQRFLTALFPVFVIGIAELLARTRMLITPLLLACIAWTAFLAVHHFYGYDFVSYRDGADRIVELYRTGEESNDTFWGERVTGPISRHWEAYLDWVGLYSRG